MTTYAIQELVIRQVSPFDTAGITGFGRVRVLYLRHGYRVRSVIGLPDGPPLWSMWRTPMP